MTLEVTTMTFPVRIEPYHGQFAARLLGEATTRVVRPTRDEALSAMTAEIQQRVQRGELLSVEVPRGGASAVAGKFADDPTLLEICAEIYAERDRQRDELPG
jgi:hypothetical protein